MNIWLKSAGIGFAAGIITFLGRQMMDRQKNKKVYNAVFTVQPEMTGANISNRKLKDILEKRLKAGEYIYEVKEATGNSIQISVKGLKDTNNIKGLLTHRGWLQFREMYTITDLAPSFTKAIEIEAAKKMQSYTETKPIDKKKDSVSTEVGRLIENLDMNEAKDKIAEAGPSQLINFYPPSNSLMDPRLGTVKMNDTAAARSMLMNPEVLRLAPMGIEYYYGREYGYKKEDIKTKDLFLLYAIKANNPESNITLDNDDIRDAAPDIDQLGNTNISLEFTNAGAQKWTIMTRKNIEKPIAIILDDKVISAPRVIAEINGGKALISGVFDFEECEAIARMLKNQPLPVGLFISSAVVKPAAPSFNPRLLLGMAFAFLLFSGIGYFILKTLKST